MNHQDVFVKMAKDNWQSQIKAFNNTLDKLSDEQLAQDIAPGRNSGTYLLGHLATVHDMMMPLLRFETNTLHPELTPIFLHAPDKTVPHALSAAQLRAQWKEISDKLQAHIDSVPADEWFTRHNNISEEDFAKEPHRNRLNVLIGRTNHLSYHGGQVALLVPRN